ncbi:MAG: protein kinase, partial [Anaerolineales bacterium]|nr:protein kinase [Anaerolineales bacterium]
ATVSTALPSTNGTERDAETPRTDSAFMRLGRAPVPPEFLFDLETATAENEADFVGRRLDRYQVEAFLGEGTLSNHYQAYDLKLARPVFLKVIHAHAARHDNLQERLLQEVRITAALDHPNIVEIFDYDEHEGLLYMVYELVSGSPVDVYLRHMRQQRGHVPLSQMLIIAAQVCDALHYAHAEGIPHGSIQPKHILLEAAYPHQQTELQDEGLNLTVKVTDFGLAQLMKNVRDVAPSMWPYLAPEQCTNEPLDGRADIYAIGVMLYQLVTGQLPFGAETLDEMINDHLYTEPPIPTAVRPSLPTNVEELILKALAKEPDQRYQTAEELADALRALAISLSDTIEAANPEVSGLQEGLHAVVVAPGEAPRYVKLEGKRLTLGSATDNNIVLPGRGVDAYHARLEETRLGWTVIDAGSQTGTYIGNARLLPDLGEAWSARQAIFIGPYEIRQEMLSAGSVPTAVERAAITTPQTAPEPALPLPPSDPTVT